MPNAFNSKYLSAKIGDTIIVHILDFDRAHNDGRNLLATITEITYPNLYRMGTIPIHNMQEKVCSIKDIAELETSLRECVRTSSKCEGQGYS